MKMIDRSKFAGSSGSVELCESNAGKDLRRTVLWASLLVTSGAWGDGLQTGGGLLGSDPVSVDVSSLLNLTPGANYETFNATLSDWTSDGITFSVSVLWTLTDQPVVPGASDFEFPEDTTVYLNPGPAGNSWVADYGPKDLNWLGYFDGGIDPSAPIYLTTRGYVDFSSYGGFDLSLNTFTPGAPAAAALGVLESDAGQIHSIDSLDEMEVNWYSFELPTTQEVSISTAGSSLDGGGALDTELGLFDAQGNLIDFNDDSFNPFHPTSLIEVELDPGLYFVAAAAYDSFFGSDLWFAETTASATGRIELTISGEAVLTADFNSDGVVDLVDLDILGAHWEMTGTGTTGDANGDGFVDLIDLDLLGQQWELGDAAFASALADEGLLIPEPASLAAWILIPSAIGVRRRLRSGVV